MLPGSHLPASPQRQLLTYPLGSLGEGISSNTLKLKSFRSLNKHIDHLHKTHTKNLPTHTNSPKLTSMGTSIAASGCRRAVTFGCRGRRAFSGAFVLTGSCFFGTSGSSTWIWNEGCLLPTATLQSSSFLDTLEDATYSFTAAVSCNFNNGHYTGN